MPSSSISFKNASITLGAFFCLAFSACGEKKSATTADWENQSQQTKGLLTVSTKAATNEINVKLAPKEKAVRFLSYNLRNYLTMRRYLNGKSSDTGKPEKEIQALLKVIVQSKPDILGICEIGTKEDLADFQTRLKKLGVELPHTHHIQGSDEVRSLAILSKSPITPHPKPQKSAYTLEGKQFFISRGILDASIQIHGKDVRFLGVHFKSKRPIREADQEMMRRNEAALLRSHIDQILAKDKQSHLMVYGDFNDTKRSRTVYSVKGRSNSSTRLEPLDLADSRGELWTHHWVREDIYSRIDYCMVSLSLSPYIHREGSYLLDPEYWAEGSDHRAMLVLVR